MPMQDEPDQNLGGEIGLPGSQTDNMSTNPGMNIPNPGTGKGRPRPGFLFFFWIPFHVRSSS
jgi:hypothetical protein